MDPDACLERFFDALRDEDFAEATEAQRDLLAWLDKGGFAPAWRDPAITLKWLRAWTPPEENEP